MKYEHALEVARNTMRCKADFISHDSDGNPCRIEYREGTAEEAARLASKVSDMESSISAIVHVFKRNEIQVVLGDRTT